MLETEQSRDSGEGAAHLLAVRAAHFPHREQHQSLVRLPQGASPSAEHLCDSEVQPRRVWGLHLTCPPPKQQIGELRAGLGFHHSDFW